MIVLIGDIPDLLRKLESSEYNKQMICALSAGAIDRLNEEITNMQAQQESTNETVTFLRKQLEEAKKDSERLPCKAFRMLLNLWMVSDPWPLTSEENQALEKMLEREAKAREYESLVDAYHLFGAIDAATKESRGE